jgi:hypothetical protein
MTLMSADPTSRARLRRRRVWQPPGWLRWGLSTGLLVGAGLLLLLTVTQAYVGLVKTPPPPAALQVRTDHVTRWAERCAHGGCRRHIDLTLAADARPLRYDGPIDDRLYGALRSSVPLTVAVGPAEEPAGFTTDIWEVKQGERTIVSYAEVVERQMWRAQEVGFTLLFLVLGGFSGAIGYSFIRPSRWKRS